MQERGTVTALSDEPVVVANRSGHAPGTRLLVAFAVTAAVVAADQLTKWWATVHLAHGPIHLVGTLDLELAHNTGASFSLFEGQAAFLVPLAVLLVAVLTVMVWRASSMARAATFGLILGGALGNLCDRLFRGDHGAVVDFVALHFWPTFNVADASIVVGCVLLLISLVRGPRLP
ncbi:MAG TPA: signal peptidase II [Acidimicrobiales bacterium]|jgi:signal peptidase II